MTLLVIRRIQHSYIHRSHSKTIQKMKIHQKMTQINKTKITKINRTTI